ncbi:hypothetical protein PLESTF_000254800 [Pleodorina starrii]|nr:hypothetical protein PLESTF_000254800 [Pleodorina starrii]
MTDERRVDMVRLVGEERVYDREALLGRDASSVFPSLARQQQEDEAAAGSGAILEALGARKFISETELETLRAGRGVTADDGAVAVDKPLAEILRERKAAKDAEHAEKWKQMKIGKNRPLDPEELQFLDAVAAAEAEREKAWSEMERAELEAFKAAVRERSVEPEAGPGPAAAGSAPKSDPRVPNVVATAAARPAAAAAPPSKPVLKPLVKVKPKAVAAPAVTNKDAKEGPGASTAGASTAGGSTAAAAEPPSKKARTAAEGGEEDGAAVDTGAGRVAEGAVAAAAGGGGEGGGGGGGGGALAALVGGYGSGSDSD